MERQFWGTKNIPSSDKNHVKHNTLGGSPTECQHEAIITDGRKMKILKQKKPPFVELIRLGIKVIENKSISKHSENLKTF